MIILEKSYSHIVMLFRRSTSDNVIGSLLTYLNAAQSVCLALSSYFA